MSMTTRAAVSCVVAVILASPAAGARVTVSDGLIRAHLGDGRRRTRDRRHVERVGVDADDDAIALADRHHASRWGDLDGDTRTRARRFDTGGDARHPRHAEDQQA